MTDTVRVQLRLYVAGSGPNSALALANLTEACRDLPPSHCRIDVVDVMRQPERAVADAVMLTPLLVRIRPEPRQVLIGALQEVAVLRRFIKPG